MQESPRLWQRLRNGGTIAQRARRFGHITLIIPISVLVLFVAVGDPIQHRSEPVQPQAPSTQTADAQTIKSGASRAPTRKRAAVSAAAQAREAFAKRFERHLATHGSLNNLVYFSLLCVGITVAVLSKRERGTLDFQGIRVPIGVAYLIISVVMTYFWVQYIITLDLLMSQRRELWDMLTWLERGDSQPMSLRPLLQGSPFINAWAQAFQPHRFIALHPTGDGLVQRFANWVVVVLTIGGVAAAVGVAHGSVFAIFDEVSEHWKLDKLQRLVVAAARVLLCGVIVATYVWFELQHRDFWFSISAGCFAYASVKLRPLLPSAGPLPQPANA